MSVYQGVPASALDQRSEQQYGQLLGPYASETVSANQEDAVTANSLDRAPNRGNASPQGHSFAVADTKLCSRVSSPKPISLNAVKIAAVVRT
jgi:hypothetical protein